MYMVILALFLLES